MDSFQCDFPDCSERGLVKCEGSHGQKGFCEEHYLIHRKSPGNHSAPNTDFIIFDPPSEYHSSESLENCFLCNFSSGSYIIKLHSIEIPLPDDYRKSISQIIRTFALKIAHLPQGKNEKIPKKLSSLSKILKQVIYNFNHNMESASKEIDSIYSDYHSQLTNSMIKYLNEMISIAQTELNMPAKVKRMFVFEAELERERESFLQQFLQTSEIDVNLFWEKFLYHFSLFIKAKPKEILNSVKKSFVLYEKEKEAILKSATKDIKKFIFQLLDSLRYQRVGLFASRLTENFNLCNSNWVLFCALILESEPAKLSTPVSLSPSNFLISLTLSTETLILSYQETNPLTTIGRINSNSVLIASGSICSNIFISDSHTQKCSEYSIQLGRMKLKKAVDLNLSANDKVTALAYIQSQDKLVYVVNRKSLHAKIINSTRFVSIIFMQQDPEILSLFYTSELNFICLKTQNFLFVFNVHLQLIKQVNVTGFEFLGFNIGSIGSFWVLDNWKAVEIRFKSFKENNEVTRNNYQIQICKSPMSRDFLIEVASGSKYLSFVQVRFGVPDFEEAFLDKINRPNEFYKPEVIRLSLIQPSQEVVMVENLEDHLESDDEKKNESQEGKLSENSFEEEEKQKYEPSSMLEGETEKIKTEIEREENEKTEIVKEEDKKLKSEKADSDRDESDKDLSDLEEKFKEEIYEKIEDSKDIKSGDMDEERFADEDIEELKSSNFSEDKPDVIVSLEKIHYSQEILPELKVESEKHDDYENIVKLSESIPAEDLQLVEDSKDFLAEQPPIFEVKPEFVPEDQVVYGKIENHSENRIKEEEIDEPEELMIEKPNLIIEDNKILLSYAINEEALVINEPSEPEIISNEYHISENSKTEPENIPVFSNEHQKNENFEETEEKFRVIPGKYEENFEEAKLEIINIEKPEEIKENQPFISSEDKAGSHIDENQKEFKETEAFPFSVCENKFELGEKIEEFKETDTEILPIISNEDKIDFQTYEKIEEFKETDAEIIPILSNEDKIELQTYEKIEELKENEPEMLQFDPIEDRAELGQNLQEFEETDPKMILSAFSEDKADLGENFGEFKETRPDVTPLSFGEDNPEEFKETDPKMIPFPVSQDKPNLNLSEKSGELKDCKPETIPSSFTEEKVNAYSLEKTEEFKQTDPELIPFSSSEAKSDLNLPQNLENFEELKEITPETAPFIPTENLESPEALFQESLPAIPNTDFISNPENSP